MTCFYLDRTWTSLDRLPDIRAFAPDPDQRPPRTGCGAHGQSGE